MENEFNSGWKTVGGSRVNRTASRGNYLKINLDEWMKSQNTGLQCVNAPKAHSQPLVGAVFDCLRMGQKKKKKIESKAMMFPFSGHKVVFRYSKSQIS